MLCDVTLPTSYIQSQWESPAMKWQFCYYLLTQMLFKTHMIVFILIKNKCEILFRMPKLLLQWKWMGTGLVELSKSQKMTSVCQFITQSYQMTSVDFKYTTELVCTTSWCFFWRSTSVVPIRFHCMVNSRSDILLGIYFFSHKTK